MSEEGSGFARGQAPGSRATRFQKGEPSPNPNGRPKANAKKPSVDMAAALRRELAREVVVYENGIKRRMTNVDLFANVMIARLPKASLRDQLAVIRFCLGGNNPIAEMESHDLHPDAIQKFVEGLIEAGKSEGLDFENAAPPEPWGR